MKEFCVLIHLVPRVTYHASEELLSLNEATQYALRHKREPVTVLTLAILMGTSLAGLGRAASLVTHQRYYADLCISIEEDIERIETSITHLQESLSSLAEVVLQNRRGLDLLFLKEKGLCYTDHSGIVKGSIAKVHEGLAKRKREHEANHSWFEAWYSKSFWFTTLISSLIGPLLLFLLILTFGPYIISRILQYMKHRLGTIQRMVQRVYSTQALYN